MKKVLLACGLGLLALTITACSEEENKSQIAGATETCNAYFNDVDLMISKASEDPRTKAQLDAMQEQLNEGKKQIAALPKDQQDVECQKGIDTMKQLKAAIEGAQ